MFFRFLLFSGLAACVNFFVGYGLYDLLGFDDPVGYTASVGIAFVCGMGVSFTLNRAYTYAPSGRPPSHEFRDFFFVSLGGLILTTVLAHVFLAILRATIGAMPVNVSLEATAHLCAIGLTAFYSFFAHKHFSFRSTGSATMARFKLGQTK